MPRTNWYIKKMKGKKTKIAKNFLTKMNVWLLCSYVIGIVLFFCLSMQAVFFLFFFQILPLENTENRAIKEKR